MKKVSEWLDEIGTHTILDCGAAKADFEKETDEAAPWGDGFTHSQMSAQIADRGKGGELAPDTGQQLIGALDVACACYRKWGDGNAGSKYGMGSQFREYVGAIARNGN